MSVVRCEECGKGVGAVGVPFTKLPERCSECGCVSFCVLSDDDLERERLMALDREGRLMSELLNG